MATNDALTTDLIIRAKAVETQSLDTLQQSLTRLSGALDKLEAEGGPAAFTLAELRGEADKFRILTEEIARRRSLIDAFAGAQQAAEMARGNFAAARRAADEYSATLAPLADRTKEQTKHLQGLEKEADRLGNSMRSAEGALRSAESRLAAFGVTVQEAVSEAARLAQVQDAATAGYDKATLNVQRYGEEVRRVTALQREEEASAQRNADALAKLSAAAEREAAAERAREAAVAAEGDRQSAQQRAMDAKLLAAQAEETARLTAAEEKRQVSLRQLREALDAQRLAEGYAAAALNEGGRAAEQAALKSDKLVAAANELAAGTKQGPATLAEQLRAVAAPASAAAQTLDGVAGAISRAEAAQKAFSSTFRPTKAQVEELAVSFGQLHAAQQRLTDIARSIDQYRALQGEFLSTGQALSEARVNLDKYAASARAAGTSDEVLDKNLADTRTQLAKLTAEYEKQAAAVGRYASQLRAAGVDMERLDAEQARMLAQARQLNTVMRDGADGSTRLGQATRDGQAALEAHNNTSRTALSLTQRMRGQVLSLTAAYVGLFGIIQEASNALNASVAQVGIENKLAVAFGEAPQVVAAHMREIRDEANRLGLNLKTAAGEYANFSVAAKAAGFTNEETFFVFSKFAEVGRSFKLSGDQMQRVFLALTQMMSKGKIQAEELRQQLGEVLPGAAPILAHALGLDKPGQLDKALEQGRVSSRNLLLFAKEYGDKVADRVVPATQTWQANLERLSTTFFEFQQRVAGSGFETAVSAMLGKLNSALSSEEGRAGAELLGQAFGGIAAALGAAVPVAQGFIGVVAQMVAGVREAVGWLASLAGGLGLVAGVDANTMLREMGRLLAVLTAAWAGRSIVLFTENLLASATATTALTTATTALGRAIQIALLVPIAAVVAYDLGGWAYEQFSWVKKVGLTIVNDLMVVVNTLSNLIPVATSLAKLVGMAIWEGLVDMTVGAVKAVGGVIADAMSAFGLDSAAAKMREAVRDFGKDFAASADSSARSAASSFGQAWSKMTGDIANGVQVTKDAFAAIDAADAERARKAAERDAKKSDRALLNEADAGMRGALGAPTTMPTGFVDAQGGKKVKEPGSAGAQKAVDELEALAAKKSADSLMEVLDAIDAKYKGLREQIDELAKTDPKAAAGLRQRADDAIDTLKRTAAGQYWEKQSAERVKSLQEERDAKVAMVAIEAQLDPAKRATKLQDEIAVQQKYRSELIEAARGAAVNAEAQGKLSEAMKYRMLVAKELARDPEREARQAQLQDLSKMLQGLQAERDARIAAAVERANMDDPTGMTAEGERVRLMTEYRDQITEAAGQARLLAIALGDKTAEAQMDALIAKTQVVNAEMQKAREQIGQALQKDLVDVGVVAVDSFGQMVMGAKSAGDAWKQLRSAVKSAVVDMLKQIERMIIQQQVLAMWQAITGAGGDGGGTGASMSGNAGMTSADDWMLAGMHHGGGRVGAANMSRIVPAAVFASAPRYHTGVRGLGLRPDERAAILQVGEDVVSKNDPMNSANRRAGSGAPAAPVPLTIINQLQSHDVLADALATPAGQRLLVNAIGRQRSDIKKILT